MKADGRAAMERKCKQLLDFGGDRMANGNALADTVDHATDVEPIKSLITQLKILTTNINAILYYLIN